MDYALLKSIHVGCALLSIAGFIFRAALLRHDPARLQRFPLARILPHVVDTVLLAAAVGMLLQWPDGFWQAGWLHAKILLLLAYIFFGARALSARRAPSSRARAMALALAAFTLIVVSALTKTPLGLPL